MLRLVRWVVVLLVCLGGIGLYLGWFTFSSSTPGSDSDRTNIDVSVDKSKIKADVKKAEEKIKEEVKQWGDRAKAKESK
jgi:hypothetical protein